MKSAGTIDQNEAHQHMNADEMAQFMISNTEGSEMLIS